MSLCARTLAALLAGSLVAGCGGGRDAAEKQIEELQAQVTKLRAEQAALADRLERAEIALRAQPKAPEPSRPDADEGRSSARARDVDRPDLDVVRLQPEGDADDPDADTPRPVLRASGNTGVIQEGASGKMRLDDPRESADTTKKKPGSAASGGAKPAGEKKKP